MKRIIINGANGYVASHFVHELLALGYEVTALVRGNHALSAEKRMSNALSAVHEDDHKPYKRLSVYDYSLTEHDFSLTPEQMRELFRGDVDYFHFAASLKYDFKSKEEIFRTNIGGVGNSAAAFLNYAGKNSRFFLISTAYSCGNITGPFEEKFYDNEEIGAFRNYYEQSKRFAENVVRRSMEERGLNAHILRLSQVVGNSKTGVTKTDYGIFDFAKRVQGLALRYPNKTVRVRVNPEATQNLIPIDTVTRYLIKTVETGKLPAIINMTAGRSIKNGHFADCLNKLLPITLIPDLSLQRREMNSLERIVAIGMSFTGGYADLNIRFETENLDGLAPVDGNEPDEQSIFRMLAYFVGNLTEKRNNKVNNCVTKTKTRDAGFFKK